jgi:hypothetical protein
VPQIDYNTITVNSNSCNASCSGNNMQLCGGSTTGTIYSAKNLGKLNLILSIPK